MLVHSIPDTVFVPTRSCCVALQCKRSTQTCLNVTYHFRKILRLGFETRRKNVPKKLFQVQTEGQHAMVLTM